MHILPQHTADKKEFNLMATIMCNTKNGVVCFYPLGCEKAPKLERQRATGSLHSEDIHPVQNIAYNSIPSEQPASCDRCDEAGYEVIDRENEYCESVLSASYSYAETSGESEHSTVSYLNVIS